MTAPYRPADETVRPTPLAGLDGVPLLVTAGEVTLFLVDDARGGIRTPVATLAAPSLVVAGQPPDGSEWVLGSGLGARVEELDLARDEELLRTSVADTALGLAEALRDAVGPTGGRVVRLSALAQRVDPGAGAVVEEVSWVSATTGSVSLVGKCAARGWRPAGSGLNLLADGEAQVRCGPFTEPTTAALLDGLTWLFALAGDVAAQAHAVRLDEDAAVARHAATRSGVAEQQGVTLLARELRGEPPSLVPKGAVPIAAAAARVLGASGHTLALPRSGIGDLEGIDGRVRAIAVGFGRLSSASHPRGSVVAAAAAEPMLGLRGRRDAGRAASRRPAGCSPRPRRQVARVPSWSPRAAPLACSSTAFTFRRPLVEGGPSTRARWAGSPREDAAETWRRTPAGRRCSLCCWPGGAIRLRGGLRRDRATRRTATRLWYLLLVPGPRRAGHGCRCRSRWRRWAHPPGDDRRRLRRPARACGGGCCAQRVALVRRLGAGDVATRLASLEASRDVGRPDDPGRCSRRCCRPASAGSCC